MSLYLWYADISTILHIYHCIMVKYLTFTSKENIIYMYLLMLFCFITVLHSPQALIHYIKVLSSIYNYHTLNIITQIICFSSCLKIAGPRVGPGPALTRPRPWGPGSGPAKNQPALAWPGPWTVYVLSAGWSKAGAFPEFCVCQLTCSRCNIFCTSAYLLCTHSIFQIQLT